MRLRRHEDYHREQLKDPVFRRAYEIERYKLAVSLKLMDRRKREKITQRAFARRLGVRPSLIARIEQDRGVSARTLMKLVRALRIRVPAPASLRVSG